jgi:hypothetical protein
MYDINELLEQLSITESQLPKEITVHIDKLEYDIKKFNAEMERLDSQGLTEDEIEEKLSNKSNEIDADEAAIVKVINQWDAWRKGQSADGSASANSNNKETEKSGSGLATVAFAGLALILTLGAVNLFKNK